jgi:hypothetical protein
MEAFSAGFMATLGIVGALCCIALIALGLISLVKGGE